MAESGNFWYCEELKIELLSRFFIVEGLSMLTESSEFDTSTSQIYLYDSHVVIFCSKSRY